MEYVYQSMDRANPRQGEVIFVCIPVYNEADNLERLVDEIMFLNGYGINVAVVNNGSTDGTFEVIKHLNTKYAGRFFYTWKQHGCGITKVYAKAFRFAIAYGADIIIGMDAGGSHDPQDIEKFISAIKDYDADCAFGSRILGTYQAPLKRKIVSRCGNFLSNLLLKMHLSDSTSGFSCFKSHVLKTIQFDQFQSRWYFYDTELKYHCRHLNCIEIPITYKSSRSQFKISHIIEALRVLTYYTILRVGAALNDASGNHKKPSIFP